jgi:hypothetical protein
MITLDFSNQSIDYETFVNDLTARIIATLRADNNDPQYISQRKAFQIFGRSNIMRWRRTGKIEPIVRPGRLDYSMVELRLLQRTKQDYLIT